MPQAVLATTGAGSRRSRTRAFKTKRGEANEANFGDCRSVVAERWRSCRAAGCGQADPDHDEGQRKERGRGLAAIVKGEKPYDQATVDAALGQFDDTAKKLPTLFPASIKGAEVRRGLQPVAEDLEDKAGFDCSHCKLRQDGDRGQGEDQGSGFAESNHARDRQGMRQLPRDLPRQRLMIGRPGPVRNCA